jgi:hypothetical protein
VRAWPSLAGTLHPHPALADPLCGEPPSAPTIEEELPPFATLELDPLLETVPEPVLLTPLPPLEDPLEPVLVDPLPFGPLEPLLPDEPSLPASVPALPSEAVLRPASDDPASPPHFATSGSTAPAVSRPRNGMTYCAFKFASVPCGPFVSDHSSRTV